MSPSETISPTAHYTGYVWARNGLSHPELATTEGRVLFESLQPIMIVSRAVGGPSLEPYLLARHRAIDALLSSAIEEHGVSQVIEVASGLSPRGWRFMNRYGDRLTYVEADLPDMAERKRAALERIGSLSESHRVQALDALRDDGPGSLAELATELDPAQGLAIITEGLLGYLDTDSVLGSGGGSRGRFTGSPAGATSPTCTSATSRRRRSGRSGCCCRRSCAAASTSTSRARPRRRRRCVRPASTTAEVRRADRASLPDSRGPGSGLVHILEASTT